MDNAYPVRLGIWINWSRGPIFGSTLTIGPEAGGFLIAFTAVFVGFVFARGWQIVSFAFHGLFASPRPQNAIYHQHQAILRNSSDAQNSIQYLALLLWANRGTKIIFGPFLTILVAAIYTAVSTLAGGFSSKISTAVGSEVLIHSENCGLIPLGGYDHQDYYLVTQLFAETVINAASYAQQCYSNKSTGNFGCGLFVTEKITPTINTSASCPFQSNMCHTQSANLLIDSGYIDSLEHLGLNAPASEKMMARYILHCGPITTSGYSSQKLYIQEGEVSDQSSFTPIDSIFRRDADVALVFLSGNGVVYTSYSDDAWYRVSPTRMTLISNQGTVSNSFYIPSEAASPMGCAVQWQFCRSSEKNCGPVSGFQDAVGGAAPLFNTTYEEIYYANYSGDIANRYAYFTKVFENAPDLRLTLSSLGPTSLTSQSGLNSAYQGPLAPNQWQLDVTHWFDILMASFQTSFPQTVFFNPSDPELLRLHQNFNNTAADRLCKNQKIRSTAYVSFSLFGILFVYIIGFIIILASYLINPVARFLFKMGYARYTYLEWTTNSTLQLQRLAHEGRGFGTWSGGRDKIPVTQKGELLGCLDITNPDHPILSTP
ncbi:hypothetical protein F5Y16DRAFT_420312 [Xylariaceae sp. FL0255]|nr:hypothetical protein F5Y16DRAFT_420312 [Xylariaceae sp. FL0255]